MKNLIKITIKVFLVVVFGVMSTTSCNEDALQENAYSFIAKENFYQTPEDAESAILGVYAGLTTNGIGNKNNALYNKWFFDIVNLLEDQTTINRNATFLQIDNFDISSDNDFILRLWTLLYDAVNISNVAINRIPGVEMDEELKTSYVAEARCIRASLYFHLVRLFGAVPFSVEEVGDEESANVSVGTVDEIYASIIEDLKFAENNLPSTRSASEFGRVTKWVAKAFLADVYLTRENWAEAASKANEIITSGQFELLNNFADIFKEENEYNNEIIYSIIFDGVTLGNWMASSSHGGYGQNAQSFSGVMIWSVDVNSSIWLNWDDNDTRKINSVSDKYIATDGTEKNTTPGYPEFRKWNAPYETAVYLCPLNPIIYRYADILLMYAEALSQANGGPTADAYKSINMVRRRAYQQPIDQVSDYDIPSGLDAASFREKVIEERGYEFVIEGKRLFDLMRTNQYPKVLVDMGKNVRPGAKLLPIPIAEIDANSSLTSANQNEGY